MLAYEGADDPEEDHQQHINDAKRTLQTPIAESVSIMENNGAAGRSGSLAKKSTNGRWRISGMTLPMVIAAIIVRTVEMPCQGIILLLHRGNRAPPPR